MLAACGGGGGATASSGFSQTFTVAGGIGELMSYTINTANKTYSYSITKSSYGLTGQTGNGTLSQNSDGSYSPSESTNSRIFGLENGLIVGAVKLNVNGSDKVVPISGISHPITVLSDLAGTYNYIIESCPSNASCNPNTNYGTIKIDSTGNYIQCTATNITTSSTCNDTSGTIVASSTSGQWNFNRGGVVQGNNLLAYKANGVTVLNIDMNDAGIYGYGVMWASTQASITSANSDGTWHTVSNTGDTGTIITAGGNFTSVEYDISGARKTPPSNITLVNDAPFIGFATTMNGNTAIGYSMLSGAGQFTAITADPQWHYYQIGVKQ